MTTRKLAAAVATAALTLGLTTACGGTTEAEEAAPSTTTRTVYFTATETVTETVEAEPSPTIGAQSGGSDVGQMIDEYLASENSGSTGSGNYSEPEPAYVAPEPASTSSYYENCTAARAAGAAPVYEGQPGYGPHLDRDRDGIGCE